MGNRSEEENNMQETLFLEEQLKSILADKSVLLVTENHKSSQLAHALTPYGVKVTSVNSEKIIKTSVVGKTDLLIVNLATFLFYKEDLIENNVPVVVLVEANDMDSQPVFPHGIQIPIVEVTINTYFHYVPSGIAQTAARVLNEKMKK